MSEPTTVHTVEMLIDEGVVSSPTLTCSDPDLCNTVFTEGDWESAFACRCVGLDCDCRIGDHNGCEEYGAWIENVGEECRSVPVEGCGYMAWFSNSQMEMASDVKVTGQVRFEWDAECPTMRSAT